MLVGELISYILQKVDQYIIFHKECNKILQKTLLAKREVVLEGMICGYKGRGKDSCRVSSRTPFYLCIEGEKFPHSPVAGTGLFTASCLHPLVKEIPSKGNTPGGGEDVRAGIELPLSGIYCASVSIAHSSSVNSHHNPAA